VTSLVLAAALLAVAPSRDSCGRIPLLPAYSHNDYRNPHPLLDALAGGYRGAEADLFRVDTVLAIGHARRELRPLLTFARIYLEPLRERLRRCGHVLPDSSVFLLTVELKEQDPRAFGLLLGQLRAYDDLFHARAPGAKPPVAVVLVGWWPAPGATAPHWPPYLGAQVIVGAGGTVRGDTAALPIALITIDYGKAIDWSGRGPIPASRQAVVATARRLAVRYGVPLRVHHAPVDLRVYQWLLSEGVTLIGTTDLARTGELLRGR